MGRGNDNKSSKKVSEDQRRLGKYEQGRGEMAKKVVGGCAPDLLVSATGKPLQGVWEGREMSP